MNTEIPIYQDALGLLLGDKPDIKDEITNQISQGDPCLDNMTDEIYEAAEKAGLNGEKVLVTFNEDSCSHLMKYVTVFEDKITFDYGESEACGDRKVLAFNVPLSFDVEGYLDFYGKKEYVISQIGEEFGNNLPSEFFEHTYRAMKDYGMSVYDADNWAWLNTLFGYDIGADRALSLITWYDDNGIDVLNLSADDKESLKNVAEMELGFHFNYAAFPDKTPDAISYIWPKYLAEKTEKEDSKMFQLISVTRNELEIAESFYESKEAAHKAMIEDILISTSYESLEEIIEEADAGLCGFSDDEAWAETNQNGTGQWKIVEIPKTVKTQRQKQVPVVCTYSFDSDTTVHMCSSEEEAIAYIKAEAEKEYNLEVKENARIPDEEIKLEFSDDGLAATITDLHGNYDDDITTWQVGRNI